MSELKVRHRAMWAMGDYPVLATEVIPELGAALVEACGVREAQRVLDVAAGSGNAAIPAALRGADVVASDLTPELLEVGKTFAAERGARLAWEVADAEAMPFKDEEFDVVLSCVGVMFAPYHEASAGELVRVTRAGGTIGLLSWTPEGFIGQMFAAMKPYAPPPPPGAQPPPLWGDPDHVKGLLGDRVDDFTAVRQNARVDRFQTAEEFRDYFKAVYGPTIAVYKNIADDPEKVAALDEALAELGRRHLDGGVMEWEYLLVVTRRA